MRTRFLRYTSRTGLFLKHAKIEYDLKTLVGDSLYFDKRRQFSSGSNNIFIFDTINKTFVRGHYGEIHKAKDSMFITKKAVVITLVEKDSMYMHDGKHILVTGKPQHHVIEIPEISEALTPILASVPLQLLSYYIAIKRGCNVDEPRNLAKSVTVE